MRAAGNTLGALTRTLAPPAAITNGPGRWMHTLGQHETGIVTELITLANDQHMRNAMLNNIRVLVHK